MINLNSIVRDACLLFRDHDFESKVRQAAADLRLQAEEASPTAQNNFVLKIVQLKELFDVRHSVFIIGNAGTGSVHSICPHECVH
jgi:hypothetical protein